MKYPSYQEVRDALRYDPETGVLSWAKKLNRNMVIGSVAGSASKDGYVRIGMNNERLLAHRIVWIYMTGLEASKSIDHINEVRSDNRWQNLRLADLYEQAQNEGLRKSNSTGRKGVYVSGRGYCASIRCKGSGVIHLGSFKTLDEAAHAYNKAAVKLHGEFARLNPVGVAS